MIGYILEINGYVPQTPISIEVTHNKIWSKNTGRSASGLMVGDIVTRKYSIAIATDEMKQEEVAKLDEAINTVAFFPVNFRDQRGRLKECTFYSDDPTYKQKIYEGGTIRYEGLTFNLIEK